MLRDIVLITEFSPLLNASVRLAPVGSLPDPPTTGHVAVAPVSGYPPFKGGEINIIMVDNTVFPNCYIVCSVQYGIKQARIQTFPQADARF